MKFISKKIRPIKIFVALILVLTSYTLSQFYSRYRATKVMKIDVSELSTFDYPEDPSTKSKYYGYYSGRSLSLVQQDETHFDFHFKSKNENVATVVFKNIDVSLMTPDEPSWVKDDSGLQKIALIDRQWNRQQVAFEIGGPHIEISQGDGFETSHVVSGALAKNCLNAGLWEVLLFTRENGRKALYYQGWFTFPLGHYKALFEKNTGLSYFDHWLYLEHWRNPAGEKLDLSKLRQVVTELKVTANTDPSERRISEGEQIRKSRTTHAVNLRTWSDLWSGSSVEFASFIPPGRYSVKHPWSNEFWRLKNFNGASFRWVRSPASADLLAEIELLFTSSDNQVTRMLVSGFKPFKLPQLKAHQYPKGLYMPMGIGVPPFYQSYKDLVKRPPQLSAYFSFLIDDEDRWINHHDTAIDGPVLHLDNKDKSLLHVYLLSYERHILVGHYTLRIPTTPSNPGN